MECCKYLKHEGAGIWLGSKWFPSSFELNGHISSLK